MDRKGISLVEILIGIVILALALLGLAAAGGVASRQVSSGRQDMARWTALQEQVEYLVVQGYDSVADGASIVQGFPMLWTVTGTDPKQITLVVTRQNNSGATVQDTVVTFIANPN